MHNTELHRDKELFRKIASDDIDAFSLIFRTYFDPLYNNALRLLKSEFWAEEVVQVVFTQLWMNRAGLEAIDNPAAYLYRMVIYKVRDRIRKQGLEIKMQHWLATQPSAVSEEQQVLNNREELQTLLDKAVNTLPPQRREVYKLKYHENLSYEEIAEKLSLSRNTVRNHMSIALDDIRAYLLKHAGIAGLILFLCFFK